MDVGADRGRAATWPARSRRGASRSRSWRCRAESAQAVTDQLVAAGIKAVLNFAPDPPARGPRRAAEERRSLDRAGDALLLSGQGRAVSTSPSLRLSDRTVSYEDYGSGPIALLIHGSPGNGKAWAARRRAPVHALPRHRARSARLRRHHGAAAGGRRSPITADTPPRCSKTSCATIGSPGGRGRPLVRRRGRAHARAARPADDGRARAVRAGRGAHPPDGRRAESSSTRRRPSSTTTSRAWRRARPRRCKIMVDFWFGPGAFARMPEPLTRLHGPGARGQHARHPRRVPTALHAGSARAPRHAARDGRRRPQPGRHRQDRAGDRRARAPRLARHAGHGHPRAHHHARRGGGRRPSTRSPARGPPPRPARTP